MRIVTILSALAFTACAGATRGDQARTPPRILHTGTTYDVSVASGTDAGVAVVRASPEAAWQALPGIYAALGIVPEHVDTGRKTIGNRKFAPRRTIEREPVSRYLNCGTNLSGAIADTYAVRISVMSQLVTGEEGETLIDTRVQGTARSRDGTSGSEVSCGTTGRLEARIAELLNVSVSG